MKDEERWMPVVGSASYAVSDLGRVRRTAYCHASPNGRILKQSKHRDGHRQVTLSDRGRTTTLYVHALVLGAFVGPRPTEKHEGAHGDGDPSNNTLGNLRWATTADNAEDRDRHGRQAKGEAHVRAVFTQADVDGMRNAHAAVLAGRRRVPRGFIDELAARHGVSRHTVASAIRFGYGKRRAA